MRKIRNQKGFTLIEMLACTVTLLLIGLICTTGMNLAMMSLRESTFESDSQMLESTMNMYLGDMLRHSTEVETETDGRVKSFTNDTYYIDEGSFVVDYCDENMPDAGYLRCTSNLDLEGSKGALVVNEGAYANSLYIKDFELYYDEEKGIFTGNYVIVSNVTDSTKICEFSYRTIAMQ